MQAESLLLLEPLDQMPHPGSPACRLSWLGKLDRKSADTPDGQATPFSLSDPDNTGEVAAQQALLGDLLRLMLEVIDSVLTAGVKRFDRESVPWFVA